MKKIYRLFSLGLIISNLHLAVVDGPSNSLVSLHPDLNKVVKGSCAIWVLSDSLEELVHDIGVVPGTLIEQRLRFFV